MACIGGKNELARSCKIVQESCMQDLLGTCNAICPFSCTILAHSCTYLARNGARDAARIITCKFAHFFARSCKNWCKIVQESCKKRDISRAHAKQVLHAQSCMILQVRFCWATTIHKNQVGECSKTNSSRMAHFMNVPTTQYLIIHWNGDGSTTKNV